MNKTNQSPVAVLGLEPSASQEEIRAQYLELIKRFPPETDPERFQEIQNAFAEATDPLKLAERLLQPPPQNAPSWSETIKEQEGRPPRLTAEFILSMGNRGEPRVSDTGDVPDLGDDKKHRIEGAHG